MFHESASLFALIIDQQPSVEEVELKPSVKGTANASQVVKLVSIHPVAVPFALYG
jgi:hypothetical protein